MREEGRFSGVAGRLGGQTHCFDPLEQVLDVPALQKVKRKQPVGVPPIQMVDEMGERADVPAASSPFCSRKLTLQFNKWTARVLRTLFSVADVRRSGNFKECLPKYPDPSNKGAAQGRPLFLRRSW